jgi:GDP-D-mannose 3',5'-epimerase
VNIGSEEMVSINQLAQMAMSIAGKQQNIRNIPGPLGVRGRNSDNRLIEARLGWKPSRPLREGLEQTYAWVAGQLLAGHAQSELQALAAALNPPAQPTAVEVTQ